MKLATILRKGNAVMEQPVDSPSNSPSPNKEGKFAALPARIGSAVALVTLAGSCLYAGGAVWLGFMTFCAIVMLYEWLGLTKTFSLGWKIAGLAYVALPMASLYFLQRSESILVQWFSQSKQAPFVYGTELVIILVAIIAATDIGAYFSGKIIGGAKLAPRISPNKTWAGLIGGATCASAVSVWLHHDFTAMSTHSTALIGVLIAILGQTGDIFESWLKRRAGVKDSGKILPGHGGLLDRFDGYTLAAPFYLWILINVYDASL